MKTLLATALAGSLTIALAAAAHAQSVQIPTPVNPYPVNPIATDGTPLPSQSNLVRSNGVGPYYTGRSVAVAAPFDFVGNVAGTGLDTAGAVVGTGLGAANGVLDGGFGAAGPR